MYEQQDMTVEQIGQVLSQQDQHLLNTQARPGDSCKGAKAEIDVTGETSVEVEALEAGLAPEVS
ncbi:hypothetical protein MN0502_17110 [Arthrobacter sp. MN05-02]|nr:hypothetical protein MN0502_17110 [Arthrobacter sp. MN05-02]